MSADEKLTYASAGVDIDAADDSKHRIKKLVESTFTAGARGAFGGFGGMFRVPEGARQPLLVASADGVGTKIKTAIEADRHDTIGHCLVNHCVNDILVQGAKPLFFLDYVAFGKLIPSVVEGVVAGVSAGCRENGASLIGGETAEMPGVYTPPDYDLAGFIVGWVEEDEVITSAGVKDGDVLVGLASTGCHTNGYSLARRIISERLKLGPHDPFPEHGGKTVADVMLAVHRSYLPVLGGALGRIHAMAHITGGGIPGNLDRALPSHLDAVVDTGSWDIPPLFRVLEQAGQVDRAEMYRAFNMGIGMIVITDTAGASYIRDVATQAGVANWTIGHIRPGTGRVHLV
ncbi:MAG: phosphoribosylformylglycinamidine cyclo-ligase [Gemmatimonadaceae bacterium]|nr:phosphoribosylformylglycinamidine cyclo-ligase [Gemmatimonadaceae bacterium]MCW5824990.1 phosphoribosylformylglycinamidine cyclo-ligase [Gemmatimonadaceae bacterium]